MTKTRFGLCLAAGVLSVLSCGSNGDTPATEKAKVGERCGGPSSIECTGSAFCNFSDFSCGKEGVFGTCVWIPDMCAQIFMPVCGCDGKTYSNSCTAASAGISVKAEGECSG